MASRKRAVPTTHRRQLVALARWPRRLQTRLILRNSSSTCWTRSNNSKKVIPQYHRSRKWPHRGIKIQMVFILRTAIATCIQLATSWWSNPVFRPEMGHLKRIKLNLVRTVTVPIRERMLMWLSPRVRRRARRLGWLVARCPRQVRSKRHKYRMAQTSGHLSKTGAREEPIQIMLRQQLTIKKWILTSSSVWFSIVAITLLQIRRRHEWPLQALPIFTNQTLKKRNRITTRTWRWTSRGIWSARKLHRWDSATMPQTWSLHKRNSASKLTESRQIRQVVQEASSWIKMTLSSRRRWIFLSSYLSRPKQSRTPTVVRLWRASRLLKAWAELDPFRRIEPRRM